MKKWGDLFITRVRPKVKRPPLFLFYEISDMVGIETGKLRTMLQVASRQKRWVPPAVMKAGVSTSTGNSISQQRNYYRKDDFIKFLKQEKANETTDVTQDNPSR